MAEIEQREPAQAHKSPSYPQRTNLAERPRWQALLQGWDEHVAAAREQWSARPSGPGRDDASRILAQMTGARDQLADAVRRLPMEVGYLYAEDRHRADEAVAALERLRTQWESLPA